MGAVGDGQGRFGLAGDDGFDEVEHGAAVGEAEHVGAVGGRDRVVAAGLGDGLVEEREAVAGGAIGGAGDQVEGGGFGGDALLGADAGEQVGQFGDRDAAQVEALAAGEDGDRGPCGSRWWRR